MQILSQLHSNQMGIEKMRLLTHECIYWVNMNADIENAVKHCLTCLKYQNIQLEEKTTTHQVLAKQWVVVAQVFFKINNENLLCIVGNYSKFPVVKKVERMLAQDLK